MVFAEFFAKNCAVGPEIVAGRRSRDMGSTRRPHKSFSRRALCVADRIAGRWWRRAADFFRNGPDRMDDRVFVRNQRGKIDWSDGWLDDESRYSGTRAKHARGLAKSLAAGASDSAGAADQLPRHRPHRRRVCHEDPFGRRIKIRLVLRAR